MPDPAFTDDRAVVTSDRATIGRVVRALPPEFREVIVLRELEGLSYREISEVVGVPVGTVMSRLARGRKRLASALGFMRREVG
ncbi:MAG: sigma-70 family RNA polymerase sigma factor [Gemmatimonadales bacterium]